MSYLAQGVAWFLVILALATGFRSCMPENHEKPLVGINGIVWATK